MMSLAEISVVYQRKQALMQQYEQLCEEEKLAQRSVQEWQQKCQKENLDVRKFEDSDIRQFWFKLRGQYEERILENNEKAAEAMRGLNDAKAHAFDVTKEKTAIKAQLDELVGVEEDYEKAMALHVEHLAYSIHREKIIRLQEKVAHDQYQLDMAEEAEKIRQVASRKTEQLEGQLGAMREKENGDGAGEDKEEIRFMSDLTELRLQLMQLETNLWAIDALETESLSFSNKLKINTLDLFFNKGSDKMRDLAMSKAFHDFRIVRDSLQESQGVLKHLIEDLNEAKMNHQEELDTFIAQTTI